ncbi:MAG: sigma 54-interacting transcriptional regulator [Myxococcales bacterium]|nr:sigma 54-interacting transcriptional regulator [Myxococcales bacterium]
MDINTEDEERLVVAADEPPEPALVVVWTAAGPTLRVLRLTRPLTLGRTPESDVVLEDGKISRRHVTVRFAHGAFHVADLASRNGTFLDGLRVDGEAPPAPSGVLRLGQVVALLVADARLLRGDVEVRGDQVAGPRMQRVYAAVADAARTSRTLLVVGPTGAGKELAARHFHRAGPRPQGPFVAVNCAAIPAGLAERVLFGAVKGAYSGADSNADGYVHAADGGVLFLDELGELDLGLQAKLLRFLETREVYAVGATRPRLVDVRVCSATHRDLRAMAGRGEFREDLYFRLGRPQVALPALHRRPEELPWLLASVLRGVDPRLTAHAQFVEACLLRPWPGNVRELILAARDAAAAARREGRTALEPTDLDAAAGRDLPTPAAAAAPRFQDRLDDDDAVHAALRRAHGNVQAAAAALDVHRNQLRRWLLRKGLDPRSFRDG